MSAPQGVVRTDNNGRILYYARNGTTIRDLRKHGVAVTYSQLEILSHWSLLRNDGQTYKTAFPVITPEQAIALRGELAVLARLITPSIGADVKDIRQQLRRNGFEDHTYTIIFSYVLDGLLWEKLFSPKDLQLLEVTRDHPFWNGAFYAVYPKRVGVPGTNDVSEDGITFKMLWIDRTVGTLNALGSSAALKTFLDSVAKNQIDPTPIHLTNGATWELARPDGRLLIPVIDQGKGDLIQTRGDRIATRIAHVLRRDPSSIAVS